MAKLNPFPEEGELVVGTVREVQNFGAFVTLEEYPGKEGFCHIREVAPGWVKRIRDFVREQQRVVCKVQGVDTRKGHVDLSIKAVNDHQKREAIQAWKNEQKADKFMQILADRQKTTVAKLTEQFGREVIRVFGSLSQGFQEAAEYGAEVFAQEGLKGPWIDAFVAFAKENIELATVDVAGFVDLQTSAPDGVKHVQKALKAAEKGEFEDVQIEVTYIGPPHYRIHVQAPDFKIAEQELQKAAERAIQVLLKAGGRGSFHRELAEKKA
ncbi:MAG TPA: translation initiation factor IF-2 subunit alpha [Candidatus Thermoplasmatota archaeon]|nr:translation initiation factor IF-2 subunit alpha [Candidatus Thermoplasmatota archaeon]